MTGDEKGSAGDGPVWRYITDRLADGPLHMTLMDPATSVGEEAATIAEQATRLGSHALMVGGSTGVTPENLDALLKTVKDVTDLPVILFPSSASGLSPRADAIYFLSTLNSTDPRVLVGEQARGAPFVHRLGLEAIGMGYVIVEPGMKAGDVSRAVPVPRTPEGAQAAVGYALAAQYFGMRLVYLEAGSGAPAPVPPDMVRAVKRVLAAPLVVGGGIRDADAAAAVLDAGADVIVTGTVAENGNYAHLEGIVGEVTARRGRDAEGARAPAAPLDG